ncbi:hypothetical protein T12_12921 [Trichinella patagoniensis]|uniref:Uncharacterized protein n=1 Tax=Trichinella patagoniensis TaxID=990121 RepID=A0A0V0XG04_9BILA|nr:hypothetical protein T12_12921 [Trichinella patagoniensis]
MLSRAACTKVETERREVHTDGTKFKASINLRHVDQDGL